MLVSPKEDSDPPGTRQPRTQVARGQCEPRDKPAAFWRAEVGKMKKVDAAPLANDPLAPISDYLAQSYGTDR